MRIAAWRSVRRIAGASRVVRPAHLHLLTRTSEESRSHSSRASPSAATHERDEARREARRDRQAVERRERPARDAGARHALLPGNVDVAEQLHLGLERDAGVLPHAAAALGDQRDARRRSWRRRGSR